MFNIIKTGVVFLAAGIIYVLLLLAVLPIASKAAGIAAAAFGLVPMFLQLCLTGLINALNVDKSELLFNMPVLKIPAVAGLIAMLICAVVSIISALSLVHVLIICSAASLIATSSIVISIAKIKL